MQTAREPESITLVRMRRRMGRSAGTGAVLAVLCWAAVAQGSASAAERVASTTGSANAGCTTSAPCDLATALEGAQPGDDVLVESGDYGSPGAPLAGSIIVTAGNLAVHGPSGGVRPRIFLSASPRFSGDATGLVFSGLPTSVSDLEVHNVSTATGASGLFSSGGSIDHVVASTAGVSSSSASQVASAIIASGATTITDTVAYATNNAADGLDPTGGEALFLEGEGGVDIVRNSTLVAATPGTNFAMEARGETGSTTVTLQNTIVAHADNGLVIAQENMASITVNADHDAISGENTFSGTYNRDGTVTSASPVFVNAAADDYHEAAASAATIDKGATVSGDPATDLDGDLRTIGSAPDIGAYELPNAPTAAAVSTSGVNTTQATVLGTVTAGGGASQVWLDYGTTTTYGQRSTAIPVSPSASQQTVSFPITGLMAYTTYHARITIVNQAGTISSNDLTFTTTSAPNSPPVSGPTTTSRGTPASIRVTGQQAVGTKTGNTYTIVLPLSVSCPAQQTCKTTTTITIPAAKTTGKRKPKAKQIVIGLAHLTVRGGQRVKLRIKLNRTGADQLRRRHLTASYIVKVTTTGAAAKTKSGKLVIKAKAPASKPH
jgi:hypothetical protein